jgi:transcriptional regulator with XRE-family HTH domain
MPTVRVWTGREARALRGALRLSVRAFAERLGVAVRTVSKWEQYGAETQPRPDTQAILDTALAQAGPEVQLRFQLLLADALGPEASRPALPAAPQTWHYETWADDLDRVVVFLSRQNFAAATSLLNRWLTRLPADGLDGKGLYLHARSLVLLADARRDQGVLLGPSSADRTYRQALGVFSELDIPRRVAQIELSLAVVAEMTGDLQGSARRYQELAADERLSGRDRARSLLWVGTALSKDGDHDYATQVMIAATRRFEDLGEADDWSVAQQKLALAHRGAGHLDLALQFIDLARSSGAEDTPMQKVRLATAHAHILLSDHATSGQGLAMLAETSQLALASGLSHQLRSIQNIRRTFEASGRPT